MCISISSNAQKDFFQQHLPLAQYMKSACGMPKEVTLALLAKKTNFGKQKYSLMPIAKQLRNNKEMQDIRSQTNYRMYIIKLSEIYYKRDDEFAGELIAIITKYKLDKM